MVSSAHVVGSLSFVFWHSIISTRPAVDIDIQLGREKTGAAIISTDGLSRGGSQLDIKSSVSIAIGAGVKMVASAHTSVAKLTMDQGLAKRHRRSRVLGKT